MSGTPRLIGHSVPRFQDSEGRKLCRRLQRDLGEFKGYLQDAHSAILEHTDELYLERQRQLFDGSVSAIEHLEALLNFAAGGVIVVPANWQKPPEP